ncbi:MAG: sel1 repeat family protein [Deltaproteobacteria bacterium]|jgi:TPR repeat protein|nr:sel1 repeat family protein [Deltaproteobacteria bacterium]
MPLHPNSAPFIAKAEEGDRNAQFELGKEYFLSSPDDESAKEVAASWLQKAAAQGHALAQYNFARMLELGDGVARDLDQAQRWYQEAAQNGDARAQVRLSEMLLTRPRAQGGDPALAAEWLARAASQGDRRAQYYLGKLRQFGVGVPQDLDLAASLYDAAAEGGFAMARTAYAALSIFDEEFEAAKPLTLDRLAQARVHDLPSVDYLLSAAAFPTVKRSEALRELYRLADQNDKDALWRLVELCYLSSSEAKPKESADKYLKRLVNLGEPLAFYFLAMAYYFGDKTPQNHYCALHLLFRAHKAGVKDATFVLGLMHARGEGVEPDAAKATYLYGNAALKGHAAASLIVGLACLDRRESAPGRGRAAFFINQAIRRCAGDFRFSFAMSLIEGKGFPSAPAAGLELVFDAADRGSRQAQLLMGLIHFYGVGVERDCRVAENYLKLAAKQGSPQAQYVLGVARYRGLGVPPSKVSALKWLAKADQSDLPEASLRLGLYSWRGNASSAEGAEALRRVKKAAALGEPAALEFLAQNPGLI